MGEERKKLRDNCFTFLERYGKEVRTKLDNICGKTGRYNVPEILYQSRTPRKNRVLISWKTVKKNNLTIEKLRTFEGGVVVEFLNNDIFNEDNQDPTFIELKNRIGSDDIVSSIISFRKEYGSSSSSVQREAFEKFLNNTVIKYRGEEIVINNDNYMDYIIKQKKTGRYGKRKMGWFPFCFYKRRAAGYY